MNKKIYKILLFGFAFLLLYLSLIPNNEAKKLILISDKINHVIAFFVLSFMFYLNSKRWELNLAFCFTFGLMIEIIQYLSKTRTFDLYDVLFNVIGVFVFLLGVYLFNKIKSHS